MVDAENFLKFLQTDDVIGCGEAFTVSVTNSMRVENCGNYSDDEQQSMFKALKREIRQKTEAVCEENVSCPYPNVGNVDIIENKCAENIWTITMEVTAKCES